MEEILRRLGQRIREIRIQRGFKSQEEFADYCKLHRTFIGHLETGRKDFRLTTIIRVAQLLGVTLEELFSGLDSGAPFRPKSGSRSRLAGLTNEVRNLENSVKRLKEIASRGEQTGTSTKRKRS